MGVAVLAYWCIDRRDWALCQVVCQRPEPIRSVPRELEDFVQGLNYLVINIISYIPPPG